MEAKILKVNDGEGQVALSYKRLAADRGNKRLEEAFLKRQLPLWIPFMKRVN